MFVLRFSCFKTKKVSDTNFIKDLVLTLHNKPIKCVLDTGNKNSETALISHLLSLKQALDETLHLPRGFVVYIRGDKFFNSRRLMEGEYLCSQITAWLKKDTISNVAPNKNIIKKSDDLFLKDPSSNIRQYRYNLGTVLARFGSQKNGRQIGNDGEDRLIERYQSYAFLLWLTASFQDSNT
ncbi:hypothetical protein HUJ04_007498 [Dendroctonus ponderosae]|nr:hypothetical protein HUJ04_007498 [Dendroctonus ponderosae]